MHEYIQDCLQDGHAEQKRVEMRALREALAYELAYEAFTVNEAAGKVDFVIPVRFRIWGEHSDSVAGDKKWRELRKQAKSVAHCGMTQRSATQRFLKEMRRDIQRGIWSMTRRMSRCSADAMDKRLEGA